MDRAIRKEVGIPVTKEFKKFWIHERRKAEPQRRHFPVVNCTSHRDDFPSCRQRFLCIGNNHLSSGRNPHAIPIANEDRKSNLILEVFDLLAERRLSEKEALTG